MSSVNDRNKIQMRGLYLYIIGSTDGHPIKIGVAGHVKGRMAAMQTSHPFKLSVLRTWGTDCAYQIEPIAHYELKEHRLNGEWFSCSKEEAIKTIEDVLRKTRRGKDLKCYERNKSLIKSVAAIKAGNAYGKKAKARTKAAVDKISDRWKQPSNIWPTKILLDEVDISLNSVKSLLGSRKIAQTNYQAAQKRKQREAKGIRYKRAHNYIDEVPDGHYER